MPDMKLDLRPSDVTCHLPEQLESRNDIELTRRAKSAVTPNVWDTLRARDPSCPKSVAYVVQRISAGCVNGLTRTKM